MMLRYSFDREDAAAAVENAVGNVLDQAANPGYYAAGYDSDRHRRNGRTNSC